MINKDIDVSKDFMSSLRWQEDKIFANKSDLCSFHTNKNSTITIYMSLTINAEY